MQGIAQVQFDGQVKNVPVEGIDSNAMKTKATAAAKELSGHKATGKWEFDKDVNGYTRGGANSKVMITITPAEGSDDFPHAEGANEDAAADKSEKPAKVERAPKNDDAIKAAADVYIADESMSMKKALESQGVTPNQFNTKKMKVHIPEEVLETRVGTRGGGVNTDAIKAAAEVYTNDADASMKKALESQGVTYNQYNMRKMKEYIPADVLEAKKSKATAADQAIREAAVMWTEDETLSVAGVLRETGATDNQHNRRKFKDAVAKLGE